MSKKDRIRRVLRNSEKPLSTNKVADRAGFDWHTADKHLKEMEQQGEVERMEWQTNLTLWQRSE